jgi:hypothetical protein
MAQVETRKLAAIMFTDIVGFSRQRVMSNPFDTCASTKRVTKWERKN